MEAKNTTLKKERKKDCKTKHFKTCNVEVILLIKTLIWVIYEITMKLSYVWEKYIYLKIFATNKNLHNDTFKLYTVKNDKCLLI